MTQLTQHQRNRISEARAFVVLAMTDLNNFLSNQNPPRDDVHLINIQHRLFDAYERLNDLL